MRLSKSLRSPGCRAIALSVLLLVTQSPQAGLSSMREPLFGSTDAARERADAVDAALLAPIGYADAQPGEPFPKLGIGLLEKLDESPYSFLKPYKVVERFPSDPTETADTDLAK